MAEYYDPVVNQWKLIDTSNRVQIADHNGELMSAWRRRAGLPWQALEFVKIPPVNQNDLTFLIESSVFQGNNNGIIYWTRVINFQQQDAFEASLRGLGVPRELVQTVSLTLGLRPGWFVLAPPEAAFRFRLSAWLLKTALVVFVFFNGVLLTAALGWRLTRNYPA